MTKFLTDNGWQWRLLRTIVQGVLGVIVANIDVLVGAVVLDPASRAIVVALCMAVLSPIMAELGKHLDGLGHPCPRRKRFIGLCRHNDRVDPVFIEYLQPPRRCGGEYDAHRYISPFPIVRPHMQRTLS